MLPYGGATVHNWPTWQSERWMLSTGPQVK